MKVQKFVCNPFRENAYAVFDEASRAAVLIDPGFYDEEEFLRCRRFLDENALRVERVLNTHLHLDHCIGNAFVKNFLNVDAEAGFADLFLAENAQRQAEMFGLEIAEPVPVPQKFLKEGDEVRVGEVCLRVLEVPGHSPGSLAFYSADGAIFSGDVIFQGGDYGRTDLPGGDETALFRSIREKILALPAETRIFCGHGPDSTVKAELPLFSKF